jgi:enamine deaminase RidA (YjgF/YER057c/UK114 family)
MHTVPAAASTCLIKGKPMTTPSFFITPGYGQRLYDALHYSQAMRVGDRVEISGQGGWNDDLVIPEAIEEEIEQAFKNVERTLATAGARWEHVVHVNSYHVGGFPPVINETMARLYRHYMPNRAPIWTQLGIEALGLPTMRIEIRVTAIIA